MIKKVTPAVTVRPLNVIAREIRKTGINVAVGYSHKKVGDHLKAALKLGIPFFTVYGSKEKESGLLTIKTLATEKEERVTVSAIAELISAYTEEQLNLKPKT